MWRAGATLDAQRLTDKNDGRDPTVTSARQHAPGRHEGRRSAPGPGGNRRQRGHVQPLPRPRQESRSPPPQDRVLQERGLGALRCGFDASTARLATLHPAQGPCLDDCRRHDQRGNLRAAFGLRAHASAAAGPWGRDLAARQHATARQHTAAERRRHHDEQRAAPPPGVLAGVLCATRGGGAKASSSPSSSTNGRRFTQRRRRYQPTLHA